MLKYLKLEELESLHFSVKGCICAYILITCGQYLSDTAHMNIYLNCICSVLEVVKSKEIPLP